MYNTIGIILQMLIAILLFWWLISKKEDTLEFQNFFDKLLIQMKRWNKFIKSITKEFINIELDNDFKVRNLIIQLLIAGTIWMIIQYVFWLNMWSLNWKLIIFIWWFFSIYLLIFSLLWFIYTLELLILLLQHSLWKWIYISNTILTNISYKLILLITLTVSYILQLI